MSTSPDQMSHDGRCLFRLHASIVILDPQRRVLLVKEGKESIRNKWNLPGGHVDHGEDLAASAIREALEETHLTCQAKHIVGIYTQHKAVRIVVLSDTWAGTPSAGDEILAVRWFALEDAIALPSGQIVGNTAQVLRDVLNGKSLPLDTITPIAR